MHAVEEKMVQCFWFKFTKGASIICRKTYFIQFGISVHYIVKDLVLKGFDRFLETQYGVKRRPVPVGVLLSRIRVSGIAGD